MKNLHIFYGVSGSGKTIASSLLSEETLHTGIKKCTPIIRFDNVYDYEKEELDWVEITRWCAGGDSGEFILDGFLLRPEWISKFRELFDGTIDLNYIFTDIDFLHETHKQKQAIPEHDWYRKAALYPDPTINYESIVINTSTFYKAYLKYKNLFDCVVLIKRDVDGLRDSTEIVLKESVHSSILRFIDLVSANPEYQDVEYLGELIRKSDSLSTRTWEAIQAQAKTFTFSGKTIADLGPFNGFFSVKVYKAGAKLVHGYDENGAAVRIYNVLTHINHCWECKCRVSKVGSPNFLEGDYDIILALNMLHHVKNMKGQKEYESAISDIFTHAKERVLVEINDKEIDYICGVAKAKGFEIAGSEYLHKLTAYGWRHVYHWRRVK